MAKSTPVYEFPYPEVGDEDNVPADIKALCDRLEAVHGAVDLSIAAAATDWEGMGGDATVSGGALQLGPKVVGNAELGEKAVSTAKVDDGAITPTQLSADARPFTRYTPKSISTEESRTNGAFGTLTTPDEIKGVVVPEGALLVVGYQALWKRSAEALGGAALFLGTNQLKVATANGAPQTQAALIGGTTGKWAHLRSTSVGLAGPRPTADASVVNTGEALGFVAAPNASQTMELGGAEVLVAPEAAALRNLLGGVCAISAGAGTYDISVRFKVASGTVTVKDRKLWAYVLGS